MAVSFSRQSFKPRGGKTIASRMTMQSVTAGQPREDTVGTMLDVAMTADSRRRVLEDDISKIRDKYESSQFKRAAERLTATGQSHDKPPVLDVIYIESRTGRQLSRAKGLRFAGGAVYQGGLLSVDRRGLRVPPMHVLDIGLGESPTALVAVNDGRASLTVPVKFEPDMRETASLLEPIAKHVAEKLRKSIPGTCDSVSVAKAFAKSLASVVNTVRSALDLKLPMHVDEATVSVGEISSNGRLLDVVEIGTRPSADRVAWQLIGALCDDGRLLKLADPAVGVIEVNVDDVASRDVPSSMFKDTVIVSCTYCVHTRHASEEL